jgi:hypothetical protein
MSIDKSSDRTEKRNNSNDNTDRCQECGCLLALDRRVINGREYLFMYCNNQDCKKMGKIKRKIPLF